MPASGSSSPIKILKSVGTANSFDAVNAILSVRPTVNVTLSSTFTPSTVFVRPETVRTSLPSSLSIVKPTYG